MNDQELDTLVARAAPVTDTEIADWLATAPLLNLCEAIMTTTSIHDRPVLGDPEPTPTASNPMGPRRPYRRIAVLATAAAAIIGIAAITNLGNDHESKAWAAPLVEFANHSPLILIDNSDWTVSRANEDNDIEGEMTFTHDERTANLNWRDGNLADWLDDRLTGNNDLGVHTVVNGVARVVQYKGTDNFTALWEAEGRVIEFQATTDSADEFQGLLDSLEVVDADSWLSALPEVAIGQATRSADIDEMLTGVPLPAGIDLDRLVSGPTIEDRFQLSAQVVSIVSCAWIEQWVDARSTGDLGAAQAAVEAMNTSHQWPIIQELNQSQSQSQSEWDEILQAIVTAMNGDGIVASNSHGSVADEYRGSLGCDQL